MVWADETASAWPLTRLTVDAAVSGKDSSHAFPARKYKSGGQPIPGNFRSPASKAAASAAVAAANSGWFRSRSEHDMQIRFLLK